MSVETQAQLQDLAGPFRKGDDNHSCRRRGHSRALSSRSSRTPGGGQRTPKTEAPSKRKQAAAESGDGDEPGESATKKPKMRPKKGGTKKKAEPQPEGGDDEGTAFL